MTMPFCEPVSRNVPLLIGSVVIAVWANGQCFLFHKVDFYILKPAVPAAYVLVWLQPCQSTDYAWIMPES